MTAPVHVQRRGPVTVVTLHGEWERSRQRLGDALDGAARFAAGEGRHGSF